MTQSVHDNSNDPRSLADLLVMVCTYNERENLPELLQRTFQVLPAAHVLVVDDQSPDGTGQWVRETYSDDSRVHLLSRSGKLGLGTALVAGFRWGIERHYGWIVNLDGDLSHDPFDIPKLVAAAVAEPTFDLAIGSRYVPQGAIVGWPLQRRLMSRVLNAVARSTLRLPVRDCSGSFRCYRVEKLRQVPIEQLRARGYSLLEELLAVLVWSGATTVEVPITFTDRQRGKSKLTLREAWGALVTLITLAFRFVSSSTPISGGTPRVFDGRGDRP